MLSYSWELQWQRHITNCAQQITTVNRKCRFSPVMRESTKIDCSRDKSFSLIISGVLSYVTISHASSDTEQPLWIPCYFAIERIEMDPLMRLMKSLSSIRLIKSSEISFFKYWHGGQRRATIHWLQQYCCKLQLGHYGTSTWVLVYWTMPILEELTNLWPSVQNIQR